MSYSIYIGNAAVIDNDGHGELMLGVEQASLPTSPFAPGDAMTQHTNYRAPSYGGWDEFVHDTNLAGLFFGPNGLMVEHPGIRKLTTAHAEQIRAALKQYREWHPDAEPKMGGRMEDANLARLEWLSWWVDWALENCECPALENR